MVRLLIASLLASQAFAPDRWEHVTAADGLPSGEVRAVLESTSGEVVLGIRGQGLAIRSRGSWHRITAGDGLMSDGIAGVREIGGALWAVGQGGYAVREDGQWTAFPRVGDREVAVVFSVWAPASGAFVWLGANGYAARLDPTGWSYVDESHGLPHAVVHQALTDREGSTWFACRRGLARLTDGTVEVFHPEVNFRSIVEDASGRLWFGTGGDGVFAFTGGEWERHLEGLAALPSMVDRRGHLWARTEGHGVYRYDGARWAHYTTADGLLSDVVYDIAVGPDGAIWFGTDRGVSRLAMR